VSPRQNHRKDWLVIDANVVPEVADLGIGTRLLFSNLLHSG